MQTACGLRLLQTLTKLSLVAGPGVLLKESLVGIELNTIAGKLDCREGVEI